MRSTTQPFLLSTQVSFSLSLSLISLLWDQPLNHFISQLWSLSFTYSDITPESSTTKPLHDPTPVFLSSFSFWYHSSEINYSTTSYRHLVFHSSPSLISILWFQPLKHFISPTLVFLSLSSTLSDITFVRPIIQPHYLSTSVCLSLVLPHIILANIRSTTQWKKVIFLRN